MTGAVNGYRISPDDGARPYKGGSTSAKYAPGRDSEIAGQDKRSPRGIAEFEERRGLYAHASFGEEDIERAIADFKQSRRSSSVEMAGRGIVSAHRPQGRGRKDSAGFSVKVLLVEAAPYVFWGGVALILAATFFKRVVF